MNTNELCYLAELARKDTDRRCQAFHGIFDPVKLSDELLALAKEVESREMGAVSVAIFNSRLAPHDWTHAPTAGKQEAGKCRDRLPNCQREYRHEGPCAPNPLLPPQSGKPCRDCDGGYDRSAHPHQQHCDQPQEASSGYCCDNGNFFDGHKCQKQPGPGPQEATKPCCQPCPTGKCSPSAPCVCGAPPLPKEGEGRL